LDGNLTEFKEEFGKRFKSRHSIGNTLTETKAKREKKSPHPPKKVNDITFKCMCKVNDSIVTFINTLTLNLLVKINGIH